MGISEMSSSYAFRLRHPVILSVFDISEIEESITDCSLFFFLTFDNLSTINRIPTAAILKYTTMINIAIKLLLLSTAMQYVTPTIYFCVFFKI